MYKRQGVLFLQEAKGYSDVEAISVVSINALLGILGTVLSGWFSDLSLIHILKRLEAGTAVEFDATMAGEANSPKYFIVEYLDGGVWKSVEEDPVSYTHLDVYKRQRWP